jgi:hypothetical protein
MRRAHIGLILATTLVAWSPSLFADVKADEKSHVEFAGMLGHMVNFFGGKAAREGVTSTVAVKGNRKATMNDQTGQIIDLGEEKVYDLDLHKKTYKVTTFDELRRRMQDAEKKAEENAKKESGKTEPQPAPEQKSKEVQFDVDVKNTGQAKNINGFDTKQVITTVTMHEKGKTIEQSGGMILTMDSWLGPKIAEMRDVQDFDRKYAQQLYGTMLAGASPEQMAAAAAMYPMLKDAMGRMRVEGEKLDGTPIQQTVTMDSVKSPEQMQEEKTQSDEDTAIKPSGGIGGVLGGLAKKAAKKKTEGDGPHARTTFMTMTNEVLKVTTTVTPEDLAIPAGFKESK